MKQLFCALLICMLALSASALAATYDISSVSKIDLADGDVLTGEYSGDLGLILNVDGDTAITMQDCDISTFGGGALQIEGSGTLTILQEGENGISSMSGTALVSDVPLVFAGSGSVSCYGDSYGIYGGSSVSVEKGDLISYGYNGAFKCNSLNIAETHVMKAGISADSAKNTEAYANEYYVHISKEIPPTGDGANLMLWTAMLAAASAALFCLSRRKRFN